MVYLFAFTYLWAGVAVAWGLYQTEQLAAAAVPNTPSHLRGNPGSLLVLLLIWPLVPLLYLWIEVKDAK